MTPIKDLKFTLNVRGVASRLSIGSNNRILYCFYSRDPFTQRQTTESA